MHWGTFAPLGLNWHKWSYLIRPPLDFMEHARTLMPEVDVTILEPGEALDLDPLIERWAAQSLAPDAPAAAAIHRADTSSL
jgi:hypothetical protein